MQRPIMSDTTAREGKKPAQLPTQAAAATSILKVPPGERLCFQICSNRVVGVWTHFVADVRTYPCLGGERCPFDHRQTSMRWQGWLQVVRYGQRRNLFLPLTWSAVRDEPRIHAPIGSLRGHLLYVSRAGQSKRNRMHAILGFKSDDQPSLPPALDLRAWLVALWGPAENWPHETISLRPAKLAVEHVAWDDDPFSQLLERGEA